MKREVSLECFTIAQTRSRLLTVRLKDDQTIRYFCKRYKFYFRSGTFWFRNLPTL